MDATEFAIRWVGLLVGAPLGLLFMWMLLSLPWTENQRFPVWSFRKLRTAIKENRRRDSFSAFGRLLVDLIVLLLTVLWTLLLVFAVVAFVWFIVNQVIVTHGFTRQAPRGF
ncbi:MAG: hypothetical protein V3V29_03790 [Acidimicrobiia bacterium]